MTDTSSKVELPKYHKLKTVRVLKGGKKSEYVHLLPGNIVKKKCDLKNKKQRERFFLEIKYLNHLKGCDFVPELLHFNRQQGILYMTYVGDPVAKTEENKKQLAELIKRLHLEYNLMRHREGKPNYETFIGNAAIMNGKMYVIDFGSPHFKIIGPPKQLETNLI